MVTDENTVRWQTVVHDVEVVKESAGRYISRGKPGGNSAGQLGDQLTDRKKMRPVLSQEQQRLSNLELDGKPRLVRGLAGSGKSLVLCNWLAKVARRTQNAKNFRIWALYANRSLQKLLRQSIEAAWKESSKGQLFDAEGFPWHNVSLLHVKDEGCPGSPETGISTTWR